MNKFPLIVGRPDAAVKESLECVRSAMMNSGYYPPTGRTLINLAPADLKKEGPVYELHRAETGDRRINPAEFARWASACGMEPEEAMRKLVRAARIREEGWGFGSHGWDSRATRWRPALRESGRVLAARHWSASQSRG